MKKHFYNSWVFCYAVQLCWLKQRQNKARSKLLRAIAKTTKKQELQALLLFGQFLQDEPAIRQAYNKQLDALLETPKHTYSQTSKIN